MLQLRPTCEHCGVDLSPNSTEAMICSYECTFCRTCAVDLLENVCPNCGGGFVRRPIRPRHDLKNGLCVDNHPPVSKVTSKPVNLVEHRRFAERIKNTEPEKR